MLNFNVEVPEGTIMLHLPTSIEEITKDYLENITSNVFVGDNYSLIGVCYREKLSKLILTVRNKSAEHRTAVIPIFIKSGKTDTEFIKNINCGDKLILAGSQIALGNHVTVPYNELSIENVCNLFDADNTAYQRSLATNAYCYFIEFKLVPNCDIHGSYSKIAKEFKPTYIERTPVKGIAAIPFTGERN